MKIFLIRHWQSLANLSKYLKDDGVDLGLSTKGVQQIKKLHKKLKKETNIEYYSSPYKRAKESVLILTHNIPNTNYIQNFKELNKGFSLSVYKHLTWEEWKIIFDKQREEITKEDWVYPKWESISQFKAKVVPEFIKLVEENEKKGRNLCIVSHNWTIKMILGYVLNYKVSYDNIIIKNWALIEIQYEEQSKKYSLILDSHE